MVADENREIEPAEVGDENAEIEQVVAADENVEMEHTTINRMPTEIIESMEQNSEVDDTSQSPYAYTCFFFTIFIRICQFININKFNDKGWSSLCILLIFVTWNHGAKPLMYCFCNPLNLILFILCSKILKFLPSSQFLT